MRNPEAAVQMAALLLMQALCKSSIITETDLILKAVTSTLKNNPSSDRLENILNLHYRYQQGWVDCDTSPYTTDVADYPSGIGDTDHVVSFFADSLFSTNRKLLLLWVSDDR